MHGTFRRTGALVGAGAVVFGALAVAAGTQADAQQKPLDQLLGRPTPGQAALGKVRDRLAEVAQRNGLDEQKLLDTLATDKTSWLDSAGTVVTSADPASGQSNAGTPTGLGATVTGNLQPGTYYLRIDNVGYGDPLNTGYSTYGSRGAYALAINPS
jgi:hypothetical protein